MRAPARTRRSLLEARRIIAALERFGAPLSDIGEKDFVQPGITFQIGIPPRRIDVITEIAGVKFQQAYLNRILANIEGIPVPVRFDPFEKITSLCEPGQLVSAGMRRERVSLQG